jgi:diphosphate-dependent phosphofructokinase
MSLKDIRIKYTPRIPKMLRENLVFEGGAPTSAVADAEELKKFFPKTFGRPKLTAKSGGDGRKLKVGVVLSGGQAAGGHNVITGIYDALGEGSTVYGFLNGPSGIVDGVFEELGSEIDCWRNTGGFDMIGAGRTKIETPEQLQKSKETCEKLDLDGLVVIGGDDSNTNAAVLAEYLIAEGCKTKVIGVPKTIDGDLRTEDIELSFGFDTACKTYAEMIGNIGRDALSAKKYFHFVKLMGRSASHIALECALKNRPNYTFISEEVAKEGKTLEQLTNELADLVEKRDAAGKNYGIVLIPEGVIEFIPEMKKLITELNHVLAESDTGPVARLSPDNAKTFHYLPEGIQKQLLLDRDPHGNVQVSMIQTEALFIETVKAELKKRGYSGKFAPVSHFFGYEGRSGFPSNFDANYCYALGFTAARLLQGGHTGYMACLHGLKNPPEEWKVAGIPITSMMNIEMRHGKQKPVIQKALVLLNGVAFKEFAAKREAWMMDDEYHCVGPIQFFGDSAITDTFPTTL